MVLNIASLSLLTGTAFTIDSVENSSGNPVTAPFAISASDFVELTIKFSPTTASNYSETLSISHDGSYNPTPFLLDIEGIGRAPITDTFSYTGAAQNWNVPAGVGQIVVDGYGGSGGDSWDPGLHFGGKGGRTQATLTVTPGSALGIYVGQQGRDGASGSAGTGGWNGGANGGTYSGYSYAAGGGGGASDIRSAGAALADRIWVAGAGGGGGFNYFAGGDHGGKGGGLIGEAGYSGGVLNGDPSYCGQGGTQTAGGSGGSSGGSPGTLGNGGNGGLSNLGGGGAAGYYGGGGGYFGGAGGGSSFTATGATGVTHTQGIRDGDGEVKVTY
jgi:hypothetical protein